MMWGVLVIPQSVWGAPLFGARRSYPVGTSPVALAVGEFNGAPGLDLATADEADTISFLENRGDGVFAAGAYAAVADRYTPTGLTSGRFNADAIADLAMSAIDTGSATFAGAVLLYRSAAPLQFSPTPVTVGLFPTCVVRADLTGDGIDDVAVCGTDSNGNGLISILRGRADFSFTPPVSVPLGTIAASRLAVQDLDHDGRPDMIIADTAGNAIWIAYGGPEPTFSTPVLLAHSNGPSSVVAADLGDPLPAVAVTSRDDGTVEVFRQTAARTFGPRTSYAVGLLPVALAVADVDGNHKVDFLAANHGSDNVTVLLSDSAGNLSPAETVQVGHGPVALVVADFNGDGKVDFATADQDDETFGADTQSVSVVLYGTAPAFTATPTPTSSAATGTPTPTGSRPPTPTPTRTVFGTPRPTVTPAGAWDTNCDGRLDEHDIETIIARVFDGESGCLTRPVTAADITATVEAISKNR